MKLYSKGGKYSAPVSPKTPPRKPVKSENSASPAVTRPQKDVTDITVPVQASAPATASTVRTKAAAPAAAAPARTKAAAPAAASPARTKAAAPAATVKHVSKKKAKRRKLKLWIQGVIVFLVIMMLTFLGLRIRKFIAEYDFKKLAKQIQLIEENENKREESPLIVEKDDGNETDSSEESTPAPRTIMKKYADLYVKNTEFFGWIKIDGTKIDYPVMRSFESNDEYLNANFDGEHSYAGIPFADITCSHDSDNILIYGHNLKDGGMFAGLFKYEKESFYKKHPTIMFSNLYEDNEYEILSVFYDRVYLKTDKNFKFYQFIDAEDEEDFDYAISQLKKKSLYDTGVDAEYGDKLITLVTCSYHIANDRNAGRFVVVARRK